MKFPYSMLLDFVRTDLTATQVGDLLTMAGFELEGIEVVEDESVLDIKVMSNRGDGLSVFGLSREVLAKDGNAEPTELYRRAADRFTPEFDDSLEFSVDPATGEFVNAHTARDVLSPFEESISLPADVARIDSEDCHRFACRSFVGVPGAAASAAWMQARLRQAGMRPISLLVDLTNYVMLELGQPLHAFDRDRLRDGRIIVRPARPGETLTTLNGEAHELSGQMMICDGERPVGVPGVMGGLETEVTPATTTVLLESANFRNLAVRKTRKQLGLSTEASYRFERSVDPDGVVAAILRFTELLLDMQPDVRFSNIVDHYPRPPARSVVALRPMRAEKLLGMPLSFDEAGEYLRRLGFEVDSVGHDRYDVASPSWRPDIVREEDLVEELGRVHGYERIPSRLPEGTTTMGGPQGELLAVDQLRDAALRAGFTQIISHSLRDFSPLDQSAADRIGLDRIGPRIPASPEHAILRDSLLPCLADAAQRNGGRNLHLFEIGRVFWKGEGGYVERRRLGLLSTGELLASDRKGTECRSADFFSLKGALNGILGAVNVSFELSPEAVDDRLHPTRQAAVRVGDRHVGILGQIHPDRADALKLPPGTFLAEIDVEEALASGSTDVTLRSVSRNPAVRRDIAVLVEKSTPYRELAGAIAEACAPVLERQWLFDVFEGPGIPAGRHSLGIALQLRKAGENFTDEEANQVRDRAVAALAVFGATAR